MNQHTQNSHTYVDKLHESTKDPVDCAKKIFPNAVAILSNSVGSCDDKGENQNDVSHSL
jgi:hypothetical protein